MRDCAQQTDIDETRLANLLAHLRRGSQLQTTGSPGWRFFAPNPGVQNVHLLVRTAKDPLERNESVWLDVTPSIHHRALHMLVNPRSRGPKALFDAMQQLSVMKANYSRFEWLAASTPYALVADAARGFIRDDDAACFQFLLMNYYPAAPQDRKMLPLLVSEWLEVAPEPTLA